MKIIFGNLLMVTESWFKTASNLLHHNTSLDSISQIYKHKAVNNGSRQKTEPNTWLILPVNRSLVIEVASVINQKFLLRCHILSGQQHLWSETQNAKEKMKYQVFGPIWQHNKMQCSNVTWFPKSLLSRGWCLPKNNAPSANKLERLPINLNVSVDICMAF